jgi:hypothetical protein
VDPSILPGNKTINWWRPGITDVITKPPSGKGKEDKTVVQFIAVILRAPKVKLSACRTKKWNSVADPRPSVTRE